MRSRQPAIDWARGVASLLMIQGHAWHAWVAPEIKLEMPYRMTRVIATLPLPAFLVLAGTAAAMRVHAAQARQEPAKTVRAALVVRGLQVIGAGYAVNVAYALLDGAQDLDTLLRADVLHVIGLSLAALGTLVGGSGRPLTTSTFATRATVLAVLVTLLCPSLSDAWPTPPALLRPLVGLFIDVPGITVMPLFPLFAWAACGAVCGHAVARVQGTASGPRAAIPHTTLVSIAALGLALTCGGKLSTRALLAFTDGTLSRTHLAVIPNVVEYAGRGMLVLGLAPLLVERLPESARNVVRQFGQASLYAYVFHIPFCYGRLGQPLQDRLTMAQAAACILALTCMSYGAVRARLWWRHRGGALTARA